jgi:hypothetical protein
LGEASVSIAHKADPLPKYGDLLPPRIPHVDRFASTHARSDDLGYAHQVGDERVLNLDFRCIQGHWPGPHFLALSSNTDADRVAGYQFVVMCRTNAMNQGCIRWPNALMLARTTMTIVAIRMPYSIVSLRELTCQHWRRVQSSLGQLPSAPPA